MSWQFLGVLGIAMVVAAFLGGGLAISGVVKIPAVKSTAGFVALVVGGCAVLGFGYLTWREGPSPAPQQSAVARVVDRVMDTIDHVVARGTFGRPTVQLRPSAGGRGEPVEVHGSGFAAGEPVEIRIASRVYATPTAGPEGQFTTTIRIRTDAFCPTDQCTLIVQGKQSLKWVDVPYDLTG